MFHQTIITLLCIVVVWQVIGLITGIVERRLKTCPHCERRDALIWTGDPDYPFQTDPAADMRCRYCGFVSTCDP